MNFKKLLENIDKPAKCQVRIIPQHIVNTIMREDDPVAYLMLQGNEGTLGHAIAKKVLPTVVGKLEVDDKGTPITVGGCINDEDAISDIIHKTVYEDEEVFKVITAFWKSNTKESKESDDNNTPLSSTDILLIASGDDVSVLNIAITEKGVAATRTFSPAVYAAYKSNL